MLFSFRCKDYLILSRFCLCHVLPYFIKRNQRFTSRTQLKKPLLHKEVSIQRRRKPCYSCEIHVPKSKAYLVTLPKIQDTPAHEVERSHSSCILSFDLIGEHQNKRFYVTEIVCRSSSQTVFFGGREATTGNTSAVRRLPFLTLSNNSKIPLKVLCDM